MTTDADESPIVERRSISRARRIIVTWKHDATQTIVPVAELRIDESGATTRYELRYLEGLRQAMDLGFQPFMAFPDVSRTCESAELFEFFKNRVLPTSRPDYLERVSALGLDPKTASYADLLGRTNGQRTTDRVETVLVPERDAAGRYATHFLVRGVRYVDADETIAKLHPGDVLAMQLDAGNTDNNRARKVVAGTTPIGFLPDHLVADVDSLEEKGAHPAVIVERVNLPPHPAHDRVLCRLEADWPDGFTPFRDARLEPYRASARPALARVYSE